MGLRATTVVRNAASTPPDDASAPKQTSNIGATAASCAAGAALLSTCFALSGSAPALAAPPVGDSDDLMYTLFHKEGNVQYKDYLQKLGQNKWNPKKGSTPWLDKTPSGYSRTQLPQ